MCGKTAGLSSLPRRSAFAFRRQALFRDPLHLVYLVPHFSTSTGIRTSHCWSVKRWVSADGILELIVIVKFLKKHDGMKNDRTQCVIAIFGFLDKTTRMTTSEIKILEMNWNFCVFQVSSRYENLDFSWTDIVWHLLTILRARMQLKM